MDLGALLLREGWKRGKEGERMVMERRHVFQEPRSVVIATISYHKVTRQPSSLFLHTAGWELQSF